MLTTPYLVKTRAYISFCTFHTHIAVRLVSLSSIIFGVIRSSSSSSTSAKPYSRGLISILSMNAKCHFARAMRHHFYLELVFQFRVAGFKRTFHGPSNFVLIFYNYPSKQILIFDFKCTLMQIRKFANISVFT